MSFVVKTNRRRLVWLLLSGLLLTPLLRAQFDGSARAKGFRVVDTYPQIPGQSQTNRLKNVITGAEAIPQLNGLLLVKEMRLANYFADGRTNLIAKAPDCLFDYDRHLAFSPGKLQIEIANGQLLIEGRGFYCDLTNNNLVISNRVQTIVHREFLEVFGPSNSPLAVIPSPPGRTNAAQATNLVMKIFSGRFQFDYESNLVIYTERVRVEDPQLDLSCEKLTMKRSTNGTVENIVAEQDVIIINKEDQSRASGDKAIYTASEGRELMRLTGRPAQWQDGLREGQAELFIFDRKNNIVRAERNASMKLPRTEAGQPDWLLAKPSLSTNAAVNIAVPTNQFIEITSEVLTIQLPATNGAPRRLTAQTNVVILSAADKSRATGDQAIYAEATGTLELTGQAVWQADQRIVKGDTLFFDRTNKVFHARRHAYLKLPLNALGRQAVLVSKTVDPKLALPPPPQLIEIVADELDYEADLLSFREKVRAKYLEGDSTLGKLSCGFLSVKFSNQVESIFARQNVVIEQLPWRTPDGRTKETMLTAEFALIKLFTNGLVQRIVAQTNVLAQQNELPRGKTVPIHSELRAEFVDALFFPHTNQVQQVIAERNVFILQAPRRAQGARAVYTASNDVVELTGNPTAQMPEGRVTEADALIWNRAQNKLMGRGKFKAEGLWPVKNTNQSNLLLMK